MVYEEWSLFSSGRARGGMHGISVQNVILCLSPSLIRGVSKPLADEIYPFPSLPASWPFPKYSLFQRIMPLYVTEERLFPPIMAAKPIKTLEMDSVQCSIYNKEWHLKASPPILFSDEYSPLNGIIMGNFRLEYESISFPGPMRVLGQRRPHALDLCADRKDCGLWERDWAWARLSNRERTLKIITYTHRYRSYSLEHHCPPINNS